MNPDFISGAELEDTCPSRKLHIVPFAALLAHDHPGDVGRTIPLLPPGTNVKYSHSGSYELVGGGVEELEVRRKRAE